MVTLGGTIGPRQPPARRSLPQAMVLLAGAAILPSTSGDIDLSPLRLQLHAIEGLAAATEQPASGLIGSGTLLPPAVLPPTAGLGLSLPSAFGWTLDPRTKMGAEISGAGAELEAGPRSAQVSVGPAVPGAVRTDCAWVAQTFQSGGEYWNTLPVSAAPTRLSPPAPPNASLADPTAGPSGQRSNLPPEGPAGAWCRPPPVPFAETSPLANRSFWIPVALVLFGVTVFWLSRGFRLPP